MDSMINVMNLHKTLEIESPSLIMQAAVTTTTIGEKKMFKFSLLAVDTPAALNSGVCCAVSCSRTSGVRFNHRNQNIDLNWMNENDS